MDKAKNKSILAVTIVFMIVYLLWRYIFTLPLEDGGLSIALGSIFLLAETFVIVTVFSEYLSIRKNTALEKPELSDSQFPDVDIMIVTQNESKEMLFRTVNACKNLEYPDSAKVNVYLCDGTGRQEMRELADDMEVNYCSLDDSNFSKANLLNKSLSISTSSYITVFDADMIPQRDFLIKTIPYFFRKDAKVGFVQTPLSYYTPDLFQYNLYAENSMPNEQNYLNGVLNTARNRTNTVIDLGSNIVYSRVAIEEAGGFLQGTADDDMSLGIGIQKKYKSYAIPDVVAHGVASNTFKSLLAEKEKALRGVIQSGRKQHVLRSRELKGSSKLSYLRNYLYVWLPLVRLILLIIPAVSVLFDINMINSNFWAVILIWAPAYLLFDKFIRIISDSTRQAHWSDVLDTITSPFLVGVSIAELLHISKKNMDLGDKSQRSEKRTSISYGIPHILLLVASLSAFVFSIIISVEQRSLFNVIVIFWLMINIKNLVFALIFMFGRPNYRRYERYYFDMPVELHTGDLKLEGMLKDISEQGLRIQFDFPHYVPDEIYISLDHGSLNHDIDVRAVLVHVADNDGKWYYSFELCDMNTEEKQKYYQFLYDRHHTLADKIDDAVGSLDEIVNELNNNLNKRTSDLHPSLRHLPRINMEHSFSLEDGNEVNATDFNYEFISLDREIDGHRVIQYGNDIRIEIKAIEKKPEGIDKSLYKVVNIHELLNNKEFMELLGIWVEKHGEVSDD